MKKQPDKGKDPNGFYHPDLIQPHYQVSVFAPLFMYLEEKLGKSEADALVETAGLPMEYLRNGSNWVSEAYADALYQVVSESQHLDSNFSYQAAITKSPRTFGFFAALAMQLFDPKFVYQKSIEIAGTLNKVDKIEIVKAQKNRMEMRFESRRVTPHLALVIESWVGFMEAVPTLFGLPAASVEVELVGEKGCKFMVSWQASTSFGVLLRTRIAASLGLGALFLLLATSLFVDLPYVDLLLAGIAGLSTLWFVVYLLIERLKNNLATESRDSLRTILAENRERADDLYQAKVKLDRRYQEAKILTRVIQRISASEDSNSLIDRTLTEVRDALGYDRVIFMKMNEREKVLGVHSSKGFEGQSKKLVNAYEIDLSEDTDNPNHLGNVFREGRSILVPVTSDYYNDLSEEGKMMIYLTKSRSFLICTVATKRKSYGVLIVDYYQTEKFLAEDDLAIVQNIANQLATSLEMLFNLEKEHELRTEFQKFVPKEAIEKLMAESSDQIESRVSEKREVTVLFSDIRGFTSMSSKLPPDLLVESLNIYFSHMTEIVVKHGGIVDKFLGDGMMVVFNAFGSREHDHWTDAARAAYEMKRSLDDVNTEIAKLFKKENVIFSDNFEVGIGIHSGEAVLGYIGTDQKLEFTALGKVVNIAARLCDLSKAHESGILISEAVNNNVRSLMITESLGSLPIRGIDSKLSVYKVVGENLDTPSLKTGT